MTEKLEPAIDLGIGRKLIGYEIENIEAEANSQRLTLKFEDGVSVVIQSIDYEEYSSWLVITGVGEGATAGPVAHKSAA